MIKIQHAEGGRAGSLSRLFFCALLTITVAFGLRLLEWPSWQNPEYRLGEQMLLATHDAYHWLAGAIGFGRAIDHPMAIILRVISSALDLLPANVAFWFPAFMGSMVAGLVFLWCALLGNMQSGVAAGLIASISPGFLGRTLLGYYDTDLITIFFPLFIALIPAHWCKQFLSISWIDTISGLKGGQAEKDACAKDAGGDASCASPDLPVIPKHWILLLAAGGLISWWTLQWHSLFPYLIRYNALLLTAFVLLFAPAGRRKLLFSTSLCHTLPALAGLPGLFWPCLMLFFPGRKTPLASLTAKFQQTAFKPLFQALLWLLMLWLMVRGNILNTLLAHIGAYLKPAADIHGSGSEALVFPSVAQSIIEVQDLSLPALFPYFHPWLEAAIAGFAGFILLLFKRPLAFFLLPLAALGLASSWLGGRMVMFGAPIVALGIALPVFRLFHKISSRWISRTSCGWLTSVFLCALLVFPFADMIPALSQGPIINRRHASLLSQASTMTPPDAMLWVWWDWGYAAHYFARRNTIADGAEHGGPSLYLPAAVFATENPRFARQVIRYTSARDNVPGNFFKGMDARSAQELIDRLHSPTQPLIQGKGRQFIITSFEMLRLGFWISNYGNWNFVSGQGEGGALSIVPQALAYNFMDGEVRLEGRRNIIFPISISVFEETGLQSRNYVQEWFSANPGASPARQKAFMESRRNINFLFNRVTDEKLAMDESIYRSMMVQLLLCDPHDPAISPYFRLLYDNVFARIYEVLPANGDDS